MTDNEIIKALKEHIERTETIKYGVRKITYVNAELLKDTLDLINRQQAEIEKFKKIETTVNGFWEGIQKLAMFKDKEIPTLEELLEYMDNLKVEAIKEFAERLKEKCKQARFSVTVTENLTSTKKVLDNIAVVDESDIDNLVKEMVGEE